MGSRLPCSWAEAAVAGQFEDQKGRDEVANLAQDRILGRRWRRLFSFCHPASLADLGRLRKLETPRRFGTNAASPKGQKNQRERVLDAGATLFNFRRLNVVLVGL